MFTTKTEKFQLRDNNLMCAGAFPLLHSRAHVQLRWNIGNNCHIFWVCVSSLSYPACEAHALYYTVICGLSGSTIFSTSSRKQHDFRKNVIEHKMCFDFLYKCFWNVSHSNKNSAIYYHKCTLGLHWRYPLFLSDFNETSIFSTYFRKILKC
jgi:hypothetical protein